MHVSRRTFLKTATLGVAPATLLGGCSLLRQGRPDHLVARGIVSAGDKPLAGVRVSDGLHVVTTNHRGEFEMFLLRDSGPFLFVVTPRGYWTERFWVPIQRALLNPVHFRLEPFPQEENFNFLFLTDIHLGEGDDPRRSFAGFQQTLAEIQSQDELPSFLWFGGDIGIQSGWGPRFKSIVQQLNIPTRCCVGNHELLVQRPHPRDEYHYYFGPTYYSFDWGRIHFVALDGCVAVQAEDGGHEVHAELSKRELAWLEEDLRIVPQGMPTIVAVHIPIVTTHPSRRGTTPENAPLWIFKNASTIIELLRRYNVPLVLQGHLHENERVTLGATEFVQTVSISGERWLPQGEERGVSNEPSGYRQVKIDGVQINHQFIARDKTLGESFGDVVGGPDLLPRSEKVPVIVNLYDGANDMDVSARVDNGEWIPMAIVHPEGSTRGLSMAHHWLLLLDTRKWNSGEHLLQFRIQDASNEDKFLEHKVEVL